MKLLSVIIMALFFISNSQLKGQNISWEPLNGSPDEGATFLAINKSGDIFALISRKIQRSMDNGNTWEVLSKGLAFPDKMFVIFIENSGYILAGGMGGVYRSMDNGNTWVSLTTGLDDTYVRCIAINDSGHIFAGTGFEQTGLFRSIDNGKTWVEFKNGFHSLVICNLAINDSGHIFAATVNSGVYYSTDNGENWVMPSGIAYGDLTDMVIDRNNHIYISAMGFGILRSMDYGKTWTEVFGAYYLNDLPKLVLNFIH